MPEKKPIQDPREYLMREVHELKEDFRAEVILANWVENKVVVDTVVQPKGLFARDHDRDILKGYYERLDEVFYLELNREGLYDTLPEGFFHQPGIGQTQSRERTKDMVSHSKRQRKEEQNARQFFQPIEQEFYRQRVALELSERRALSGFVHPDFQEEFARFWDLPLDTPPDQLARICYLLPLAHRIVGKPKETVRFLEIVMQEAIQWINCEESYQRADRPEKLRTLGKTNLGLDFILGDTSPAVFPNVLIRVGPVEPHKIQSFLPGNMQRRLLETLFTYLIPVGYTVKTQISEKNHDRELKLDTKEESGLYLGYNTVI